LYKTKKQKKEVKMDINPLSVREAQIPHFGNYWYDADAAYLRGMGSQLVKMSLPYYFEKMKLQTLFCQPYALNPAPNRTLEKAGFEFVKKYSTTPGAICFEQEVNLWKMEREDYAKRGFEV